MSKTLKATEIERWRRAAGRSNMERVKIKNNGHQTLNHGRHSKKITECDQRVNDNVVN